MNAIVLAGGYGSRLRPLTDATPKPMLTAANRPIIDYCVSQLYHYGIRDIVFTLGYLPQQIIEWAIGYTGISTRFSVESTPLGTLGGVKSAADFLDDNFVVLSGDGLSDINLNGLLNRHLATKALVTAAVKKVDNPQLYGVAMLGSDGLIHSFIEKPHNISAPSFINCGVYVINKAALSLVSGDYCDFARDLFPILVEKKRLAYYEHIGYWQDIGDLRSFYDANFDMLRLGVEGFYPQLNNFNQDIYGSRLMGGLSPSLVNNSALIKGRISECICGENTEIGEKSSLENCVILKGAKAHDHRFGSIIGENFCIDVFDLKGKPKEKSRAFYAES